MSFTVLQCQIDPKSATRRSNQDSQYRRSFRVRALPLPVGRVFLSELIGVKRARRRWDPSQDR
jgi:hypothetical protein